MSDSDNKISQVHTACRNCVFAQYKKNTQTGCKLGKLDDYRNAEINVIEVTDGEKHFNVIDGRFCMFYRNEDIMKNYPKDTWEKITKLQTKVPYHAILFLENDHTVADVKKSLSLLKSQSTSPNLVTIVNKQYSTYVSEQAGIKPSVLLELLQDAEFHQYSLKNIYDDEIDDRELVDLVFDSFKDKSYPFYVTFKVGFDIPSDFSDNLNNSVLIKMLQLGFVKPIDDINGMIVNKVTHKKHGGNSFGIALEDKVMKYEDDAEKFMFEIGDICPSIK